MLYCVLWVCPATVCCGERILIPVFPLSFFPQVIREYMFDNEGLWEQTARVQIWQQVCVSVSVCVNLCVCLSLCLCAPPSVCLSDLCLRLIVSVSPPCAAARCARSTLPPLFYSLRLESDPWLLRARWRAPQYASYHPHDPVSEKREIRGEERHTYCALCAVLHVMRALCYDVRQPSTSSYILLQPSTAFYSLLHRLLKQRTNTYPSSFLSLERIRWSRRTLYSYTHT